MKKKNKKFKQYEKLLRKDGDYDFGYLLVLERFKLKRMVKSFEEASHPHVGIEFTIRDMKMCVKLIDIVLEEDAYMETYMEDNYGPNGKIKISVGEDNILQVNRADGWEKIPTHVNVRNHRRFGWVNEPEVFVLMEYRRVKALRLYNKIRNRIFSWWW
jgi:hypothetical protein